MSRPTVPLRRVVPIAAVALVLAASVAVPGYAGTRPTPHRAVDGHDLAAATLAAHRAPAGAVQSVQLALVPRDRGALTTLAAASGLSRSTRLQRLDAALPGTARSQQVGGLLRRLGLTVTGSDALTVSATGPAATVAALFGTAQDTGLATAQVLPRIPADLQGLVTAAYGGDDVRPAELPLGATAGSNGDGSLSIAQTRSLYGTTATTASPAPDAPIVATLQFTSPSVVSTAIGNANTFAANQHLYSDVGYQPSQNITQVDVPETCTAAAGADDGVEVGLDTETLLAAAPQLRQRVYQVPNCGNAQDDALDQIVTDVKSGLPIVAVSTSWGACETSIYGSTQADLDAVDEVLAAGVTIFAASGDNGSFDCVDGNSDPITSGDAVDSPAAVPGVVAVGGTTLSGATPVVWDDGLGSATGGGFSCGYFAKPSYQSGVARTSEFPHNAFGCPVGQAERMVPDIAEDGGDGIDAVFTTTGKQACSGCTQRTYGTSFAAPLAAGGFAQTLDNAGITTGLGDIHTLLYGGSGLTDVVSGRNGDYAAGAGYDLASGLGTPTWPRVLGPRVGRAMAYVDPTLGPTVSVGWAGSAPLGVRSISMQVTDQSGTQVASYTGTASGHTTFAATQGNTYVETVTVVDDAGQSTTAATTLVAPLDEHRYMQFTVNTGWRMEQYSLDWQHTDTATVDAGAEAKIVVNAKIISVFMRTGPSMGEARFYVDGHLVRTFDSYTPAYQSRVLVPLATFSTVGSHTVQMFVLGAHSPKATGNGIRIDAVLAQR